VTTIERFIKGNIPLFKMRFELPEIREGDFSSLVESIGLEEFLDGADGKFAREALRRVKEVDPLLGRTYDRLLFSGDDAELSMDQMGAQAVDLFALLTFAGEYNKERTHTLPTLTLDAARAYSQDQLAYEKEELYERVKPQVTNAQVEVVKGLTEFGYDFNLAGEDDFASMEEVGGVLCLFYLMLERAEGREQLESAYASNPFKGKFTAYEITRHPNGDGTFDFTFHNHKRYEATSTPLAGVESIIIGRNGDVKIDDPSVSRLHCQVSFEDGDFKLRDNESGSGTAYYNAEGKPEVANTTPTLIPSAGRICVGPNWGVDYQLEKNDNST